jgi:hypothetical protein
VDRAHLLTIIVIRPQVSSVNDLRPQRHYLTEATLGYWLTHSIQISFPVKNCAPGYAHASLSTYPEDWPEDATFVEPFEGTRAAFSSIYAPVAVSTRDSVRGHRIWPKAISILAQLGATHLQVTLPSPDSVFLLNHLRDQGILYAPQDPFRGTHRLFTINLNHSQLDLTPFSKVLPEAMAYHHPLASATGST